MYYYESVQKSTGYPMISGTALITFHFVSSVFNALFYHARKGFEGL